MRVGVEVDRNNNNNNNRKYGFKRQRKGKKSASLPEVSSVARVGQSWTRAKARSRVHGLDVPHGWQEANYLSHYSYLFRSALAGSWSQV